jgi:hypothetical protein
LGAQGLAVFGAQGLAGFAAQGLAAFPFGAGAVDWAFGAQGLAVCAKTGAGLAAISPPVIAADPRICSDFLSVVIVVSPVHVERRSSFLQAECRPFDLSFAMTGQKVTNSIF